MVKSELIGESLALLLKGKRASGEDDWAVFPGIVVVDNETLFLDRGVRGPRFELRDEWLCRVRPVEPEFERTFDGARYFLPLTVGNLNDDFDDQQFVRTGLRWPE